MVMEKVEALFEEACEIAQESKENEIITQFYMDQNK